MNIEIMRKHYERTPKETLINVLVESREQVDKLQKRNKELKQEIERLHSIIKKLEEFIEREIELYTIELTEENERKLSIVAPIKGVYKEIYNVLQELKGSDKE